MDENWPIILEQTVRTDDRKRRRAARTGPRPCRSSSVAKAGRPHHRHGTRPAPAVACPEPVGANPVDADAVPGKTTRTADILPAMPGPGAAGRAQASKVEFRQQLLEGTSMGGARPKAVVQNNHVLWLTKFGQRDDRWNHPRVEHALLELARECGLDAAGSRVERIGDGDVVLVRRFDREWTGEGYHRHRMVSALTLLQAGDDPTERGRWSYLTLADELRRASAAPREDLRELFGRMCFNAAVSNLDDHPRNHALLAKGRDWRLSPAYDLTPMPAISVERRDLAMICGPAGRWANKENLVGAAGRFLLERDEAEAVFDRIAGTVRASWHSTMRRAGVSEKDCELVRGAFLYEGLFFGTDGANH